MIRFRNYLDAGLSVASIRRPVRRMSEWTMPTCKEVVLTSPCGHCNALDRFEKSPSLFDSFTDENSDAFLLSRLHEVISAE